MDGWVLFLLGLVLGVPLSIFANIATPWVITYFKNRSLSSRQRKVIQIVTRYGNIISYRENPTKLIIWIIQTLLYILSFLITLIVIASFGLSEVFIRGTASLFMLITLLAVSVTERLVDDVNKFEEYKEYVISRLSKLGYSLEEAQELKNKQVGRYGNRSYRKETPSN